jgi:Putative adhesin
MSGEWTVSEPQKLVFDDGVDTLKVRIAGGAVNVVGVEGGPARLEVSELDGPPLIVRHKGGELNVSYEDLRWEGLLQFLDRRGWHRHAVVSLAVPKRTKVMVGVVGASAVVSRIADRTTVRSAGGDMTLVDLTGPVSAETVSGVVEAQGVSGDLKVKTVSSDLTVVEGGGKRVGAESVSGNIVLDLASDRIPPGADIRLTTVSGEIAVRMPDIGDTEVEAGPTSGAVSCAFDELRVTGQWGWKKITGRVGSGGTRLKATTVSGAIALLRRPAAETDEVTEKEL